MAIWSYAYEICLTDVRPRIKRVRAARRIPVAWTPAEIVQLYDAAGQLSGEWVGISRNSYLQSLIIGLYSTGLRLGDTLSIAWPQINEAGSVRLVVSKTGREVVRHLDPIAIRLLRENGAPQRPLCWPLWGNRESLYRVFRGLVQSTLPESRWGTTKWLRRSGATEVARQQGIDAARYFLDHTSDAVTRRHYLDPMRQQIDIIRPPSLGIGDDEHGNDEPGDA